MAERTLEQLAEKLRDIDFAMLQTKAQDGSIAGRPMSNNREVDYDGDSYYFTSDQARMVADIERDAQVALSFQASKSLLGKPGIMIAVEGRAEIIRDRAAFKERWSEGLDRWFKEGPDTPGLAMIKVHASRIHWWDGEEDGEVTV